MTDPTTLDSMCMTYRHDFGLLPEDTQQQLRLELGGLWEHHVRPLAERVAELEAQVQRLTEERDEAQGIAIAALRRQKYAERDCDEARARAGHAEEQWGRLADFCEFIEIGLGRTENLTDADHQRAEEWRQSQGATDAD